MKELNKLKTFKSRSLKNQEKMKMQMITTTTTITITKVRITGKRVKVREARTNTMSNLERKRKMIELNIDYHETCSRI